VTQVITGQNPRPSGNLPRPPDFDSANGGKDSPQKIHHRPVRQINHILFLADRSKEPEQYRTYKWGLCNGLPLPIWIIEHVITGRATSLSSPH